MEVRISIVFLFASPGENGERGEMEYKKFEEKIINLLQEKMGAGYVVQTAEVMKNNDIRLKGIVILRESDKSIMARTEDCLKMYRILNGMIWRSCSIMPWKKNC